LPAPKQATDWRVGACKSTGSLISGGTHMRQRVPCCWKWHSSKLHRSILGLRASRRSFFYRALAHGVCLRNLGTGLSEPKSQLPKQALTLPDLEPHAVVLLQMVREELAVPERLRVTETAGLAAQLAPELAEQPRGHA